MLVLFYFIFLLHPFAFSTLQLLGHQHPHLNNTFDQPALTGFMLAITYIPSLPLHTKPNISFCEWTGVICSRRRQRVVSLNVSSMALQGTISPLLANLSFLRILNLSNNHFNGHIPYQLVNLFRLKKLYLYLNQFQGSRSRRTMRSPQVTNLSLRY